MSETDVFVINGSIRDNGNTDAIIAAFTAGAQAAGIGIRGVKLREKRIGNCDGCCACANGECPLPDDMKEICSAIEDSGIIIFASPIYWCGVTGLMKTFLDRLFYYYHPCHRNRLSGKKAVILTPMHQNDIREETFILKKTYEIVLRCIGLPAAGFTFFPGLMEKDAAARQASCIEKARRIGEQLPALPEEMR